MRRLALLIAILLGVGVITPPLYAEDSVEIQRGEQLVIWPLGETTASAVFGSVTVACQRQSNQNWLCYIPEHRATNFTIRAGDVLWVSSPLAQTIRLTGATTQPTAAVSSCNFTDATATVFASTFQVITASGSGTAFYIGNGEFLTAAHVVDGGGRIQLRTQAKRINATLVGLDSATDLALLRANSAGLTPLVLADFDGLRPGQTLGAAGFPGAAENFASRPGRPSVSSGVLSKVVERGGVTYIQTNAELNPGNSGGPLFTDCGEIVGVVSTKYDAFGGRPVEGISYATTLPSIHAQLPQLRAGQIDAAPSRGSTTETAAPRITAMCNKFWDSAVGDWSGYETAEACHLAGLDGISFSDRSEWWGRGFLEWEDLQYRVGNGSPLEEDEFSAYVRDELGPGQHLLRIRERISPTEWTDWGEPYTFTSKVSMRYAVCNADPGSYWGCHSSGQDGISLREAMIGYGSWVNVENTWYSLDGGAGVNYQTYWDRFWWLPRGQHTVRMGEFRSWGWTGWSPPFTFTIR